MSIQTKIQTKNGKKVTLYYPVVSTYKINKSKTPLWGSGYLKKEDAKLEEARMKLNLQELVEQLTFKSSVTTFKEIKELWLETRSTCPDNTKERDTDYCNIYLSVFDDLKISEITALDIQNWVTLLSQKYAPKTVRMALNLLSQIMDYAIAPLKVITQNPCHENIQKPKIRKKGIESDKFWTEEELKFFLNHPYTKDDPYYNMYIIHVTLGLRPGEVCGLSTYDYNSFSGKIVLNHGLDKKGRLTDLKNTGAQRSLKLPASLLKPLDKQLAYSDSLRDKNAKYPYLFVLEDGSAINPDTYRQHLQRLIERINDSSTTKLKPITPYGFRHTFATLSLAKGIHIKAVAEVMGDSVETIMQNYAHILEQMTADALELMADTILG